MLRKSVVSCGHILLRSRFMCTLLVLPQCLGRHLAFSYVKKGEFQAPGTLRIGFCRRILMTLCTLKEGEPPWSSFFFFFFYAHFSGCSIIYNAEHLQVHYLFACHALTEKRLTRLYLTEIIFHPLYRIQFHLEQCAR